MNPNLSPALRRFLARDVVSVEALEVLLLLRRARAVRTIEDIVLEMRSTVFAIRRRLDVLSRRSLVERVDSGWRYCANQRAESLVAEAAAANEYSPLRVIDALYGGEQSDTMRAFSDAFRLREEDEDDDG